MYKSLIGLHTVFMLFFLSWSVTSYFLCVLGRGGGVFCNNKTEASKIQFIFLYEQTFCTLVIKHLSSKRMTTSED